MMQSRSLCIRFDACGRPDDADTLGRMAYQWIHVEGYGREAGRGKTGGNTMDGVIEEAARFPPACPHVKEPVFPTTIYGIGLDEVSDRAHAWAAKAKDARGHALRKDGLCLLGGVVSFPDGPSAKDWARFKTETLHWLKARYGDRLLAVVEHTDESHRHLHFYGVPLEGERFDVLHDGLRAAQEANPTRGDRKLSETTKQLNRKAATLAFASAMRAYQDDFSNAVGSRFGLARIGPRRRRLSRAGWMAENQARNAQAALLASLEAEKQAAVTAKHEAFEAKRQAVAVLEELKANGSVLGKALLDATDGLSPAERSRALADLKARTEVHFRPNSLQNEHKRDRGQSH